MAERTATNICNVALIGHGGAGKTTFVDHLLHAVGVAKRPGDVEAGTSLSDYEPEEKERKFSIHSAVFHFETEGRVFNLFDTPGYPDFVGATLAVLPVVETALIAINAREGLQLNVRRMWAAAGRLGLARMLLVSRCDGENIQIDKLLGQIRENFGTECVPAFLPVGLGHECRGVVDLLGTEQAPDGVVGDFAAARQALREAIIECDDALTERYLEGSEITTEELARTLRKAVAEGSMVPILFCAAKGDIGITETLRFLAACAPAPAERAPLTASDHDGQELTLSADPQGPFCARVFKSMTDVHVGKIAYFRIYSGSLAADLSVVPGKTGKSERLGHVYVLKGHEQEEVHNGVPGDILCVAKVEALTLGETLSGPGMRLTLPPMQFPHPMMALAVEAQSREDEQKINTGLLNMAESDPTFTVGREHHSGELVITGMSGLHLDVMLSRLKKRYDVAVATREPSVPYRETVTMKAEGKYRHKKQTGGRGQFGEVYMRVAPREHEAGFEFLDEVVGGTIPRQYIPAVEKGVREVLEKGPLAGYPIVDVAAAAYYGSYHSVDSSEAAFKIAGARAFQDAFEQAKPVLLEPLVKMEVTIPPEFMGDVTGNLSGHRARILGMDQEGTLQIIKAEIPLAEVGRYSPELKSMTGGEGSFTLEFSHYEVVPAHVQQEIIARRKRQKEEEA